ncbi:nuclear transport factor 2 family protein [Solidesulfovibrio alcoholivorans]|uniref:nuclear transport factor 2 family protein n=1 Tax=Solidesulfovibrio alcoholivorans TaxID=81406 RepID=UPI00049719DF|nr:nuclear transport factor 2 family protein [Solidesulfovibrio alcoholivorans]
MPIELPTAIAGYFMAANAHDATAMLRFFTQDAAVIDEKQERRGHVAIGTWEKETNEQYQPHAEPISVQQSGEEAVVMATVSGNFAGSPVTLRFAFRLTGDLIGRLEITVP